MRPSLKEYKKKKFYRHKISQRVLELNPVNWEEITVKEYDDCSRKVDPYFSPEDLPEEKVFVTLGNSSGIPVTIPLSKIDYIRSDKKTSDLIFEGRAIHSSYVALKVFEKKYKQHFLRLNRDFIAKRRLIERMEPCKHSTRTFLAYLKKYSTPFEVSASNVKFVRSYLERDKIRNRKPPALKLGI